MSGDAIVRGIVESARALGINPLDLATAISYETGGTFDPTQPGPTTQWGQHRGLIQFGEPQAREYGVDWNDPVGSQLGEAGAVVKYLRKAGVRPGMGLLDIYSAINAGHVGRYNASDANNGGAPGTVADKVNDQMAGHRAKAADLLSGIAGTGAGAPQAPAEGYTPGNYVNTAQGGAQQPENQLAARAEPQMPEVNALAVYDYTMPTQNQLALGGFDAATNPFLSYLRG